MRAGRDSTEQRPPVSASRPRSRAFASGPLPAGWIALFLVVWASALWIRCDAVAQKRCLERDESTSYLAAAAKQAEFASKPLANRWAPTRAWQAYHVIDEPFAFARIRRELVEYDLHPPLYFWLLHVAGVLDGGLSPGLGSALNTGLHAIAIVLLFALALVTSRSPPAALLAVTLWSFSPPVVATTLLERQYELTALFGIAAVLCLFRTLESERHPVRWVCALGFTALLAGYTHYQALLLVPTLAATAAVAAGLRVAGGEPPTHLLRRVALVGAALSVAGVGLVVIQPEIVAEIRSELPAGGVGLRLAMTRVPLLRSAIERFVPLEAAASAGALGLVAAFVLCAAAAALARARTGDATLARACVYALTPLLVTGGAIAFLFLSFRSPQHAMGDRYLAMLWPFLALTLSLPLAWIRRAGFGLAAGVAVGLPFAILGAATRLEPIAAGCWPPGMDHARHYESVVFDTTQRGRILPFLPHLDPNGRVFAAHGAELLEHAEGLLDGLEREALVYHLRGYKVGPEHRTGMIELVERAGFRVGPADDPVRFIDREDEVVVLLATRRASRSDALSARLEALGANGSGARGEAGYAAVVQGGHLLAQATARGASLSLTHEVAGRRIEARLDPAEPDSPLSVRLDGESVIEGRFGLAVLVLRADTGEPTARTLHWPTRGWKTPRVAFRIAR